MKELHNTNLPRHVDNKDEALGELYSWLNIIGELTTPRPFWGSTFQLEGEELSIWIRRILECKISITGQRIKIPSFSERSDICHNLSYGSLTSGTAKDDRRLIHITLLIDDANNNVELRRDLQLEYLYSKKHNTVIFTSNVLSSRFRQIARKRNAGTLGFAYIDENEHVILHFIEVKDDILEIERTEELDREEEMHNMAHSIIGWN
jgi:hypothetical protein